MFNKKRGSDAERELLHLLSSRNFAVARVAGSGMISESACDLFAGNGSKRYAIEVKIASSNKRYFNKEQIQELITFSKQFGLIPLIAIKFLRQGWWFVKPNQLDKTGKAFVISLDKAKRIGQNLL